MKKRTTWIALGLLMACWVPLTFGLAQERTNLGVITLPKDAEFPAEDENGPTTASLPKGEYVLILLSNEKMTSIGLRSQDTGTVFGCPTEVTEVKENYAEPKSEVGLVTKDGVEYVRIAVYKGNIQAVSMIKCSK